MNNEEITLDGAFRLAAAIMDVMAQDYIKAYTNFCHKQRDPKWGSVRPVNEFKADLRDAKEDLNDLMKPIDKDKKDYRRLRKLYEDNRFKIKDLTKKLILLQENPNTAVKRRQIGCYKRRLDTLNVRDKELEAIIIETKKRYQNALKSKDLIEAKATVEYFTSELNKKLENPKYGARDLNYYRSKMEVEEYYIRTNKILSLYADPEEVIQKLREKVQKGEKRQCRISRK